MSPASTPQGWVLGRIGAAPVVVSPTSLLLGLLIAASWYPPVSSTLARLGLGAPVVLVTVAGTVLGVGLSVLVHELSHGLAGTVLGRRPVRYELYLWGGRTTFGSSRAWAPWKDVVTSLAGPAANLALWAAGRALLGGGGIVSAPVHVAVSALTWVNFALAVFNALPALPLDGGHALASLIAQLTGRPQAGRRRPAPGRRHPLALGSGAAGGSRLATRFLLPDPGRHGRLADRLDVVAGSRARGRGSSGGAVRPASTHAPGGSG